MGKQVFLLLPFICRALQAWQSITRKKNGDIKRGITTKYRLTCRLIDLFFSTAKSMDVLSSSRSTFDTLAGKTLCLTDVPL